jgi:pimeloyl-ACP methyl ester carboxylesterase
MRVEAARYDANARVEHWQGRRHLMTFRRLGSGKLLLLLPGLASTYRGYSIALNRLAERFETIVIDYPGENSGDRARLGRIRHEHLAEDLLDLADQLGAAELALLGLSFGSTVALRVLHLGGASRMPRAVLQGAFAHRRYSAPERMALAVGRRYPGRIGSLPLHQAILTWNNRYHFPAVLDERWEYYVEQNALTPIASLAHRCDLLARLDLRPLLPQIQSEILLLHGSEDRLVGKDHFEELKSLLPRARGVVMPLVGHQPHFTHAELLAATVAEFLEPSSCGEATCPGPASCDAGAQHDHPCRRDQSPSHGRDCGAG